VRKGGGSDHVAYEVDQDLIVRFATNPDPACRAKQVHIEGRILAKVKAFSPPAVPDPLLVVEDDGVLVYRKILGTPLLNLRADVLHLDLGHLGEVIGEFLSRLHQAPVSAFDEFAPPEQLTSAEWLASAQHDYEQVVEWVPATLRARIETFLTESSTESPQVAALCHNDLGIEHILVDPAGLLVTGIIDWADAAITDPACDLARIYRDLGTEALASVLDHYVGAGEDFENLKRRAAFYARCSVFEEMAYGLIPGNEAYFAQSLSALHGLFGQ
jgi:aminoglycoside phosphotransferase (APT) family kinase protein